jgi:hypothetical protein
MTWSIFDEKEKSCHTTRLVMMASPSKQIQQDGISIIHHAIFVGLLCEAGLTFEEHNTPVKNAVLRFLKVN